MNIVDKAYQAYEQHFADGTPAANARRLLVMGNVDLAVGHRAIWCLGWIRQREEGRRLFRKLSR